MKIRCLKCNDLVESKYVHNLKRCKCEACFIYGGDKYTRIGVDLKYINLVHEDGIEVPCLKNSEKWSDITSLEWKRKNKI